jgi:hypothetical protein
MLPFKVLITLKFYQSFNIKGFLLSKQVTFNEYW